MFIFLLLQNYRFSIVGTFNRITQEASAISISFLHLPPPQILMHSGVVGKAEGD